MNKSKSRYSSQLAGKIFLFLTTLLISSHSSASMRLIISDRPEEPETGKSSENSIPTTTHNRPEPPQTGTPLGETTPAGTRTPADTAAENNCPKTAKPLTALFANNGSDFTVSEYPTFLFYIPYASEQIGEMEFVLQAAQQNRTVYHKAVKLTDKGGIIKISIPANPQYALKVNEIYRWHFNLKLDCAESYQVVKGWMSSVPMTSQLENQLEKLPSQNYLAYQEAGIWYDAIANLAELHFANPDNQQLSSAWTNLLKSLDLPGVTEEPLVNSELFPPKD